MKKQYLAQFAFKGKPDEWHNASLAYNGKRYQSTKTEATNALKSAIKRFNNKKPGVETEFVNGIGISTIIDEKTIDYMTIIKTRIKVREVTDWEEVI